VQKGKKKQPPKRKKVWKYATVNQHQPAHHEGWRISGQETVFCWVPVHLANHGGLAVLLPTYLLTTHKQVVSR
jgi:hypothetical protein